MNCRIPTIEEIYDTYHKETVFAMKGFYPKTIKNYDKVLNNQKKEFLIRFQNVIKRNFDLIDWKLYIKACAQYFKRNFDLKILGSLKGNKIYRIYINYDEDKSFDNIESEILSSVKFIKLFCEDNSISIEDYFHNREDVIPIILKHIYSGSVSSYFYACFQIIDLFKIFGDISDDVYNELFNCDRNDFLNNNISKKHSKIICSSKLLKIINILNNKFINKF